MLTHGWCLVDENDGLMHTTTLSGVWGLLSLEPENEMWGKKEVRKRRSRAMPPIFAHQSRVQTNIATTSPGPKEEGPRKIISWNSHGPGSYGTEFIESWTAEVDRYAQARAYKLQAEWRVERRRGVGTSYRYLEKRTHLLLLVGTEYALGSCVWMRNSVSKTGQTLI